MLFDLRFAPAVSGNSNLHIGNLFVFLLNILVLDNLKLNNTILLRIDFNEATCVNKEQQIIDVMYQIISDYELDISFLVVKQKDRFERYRQVFDSLFDLDLIYKLNNVYYLNIKKLYSNNHIIRFVDLFRGKLYKSIEYINNPIIYSETKKLFFYNFMSVVDDIDYGIKYVVRGGDHIDNTFLQICIFTAIHKFILNTTLPVFAHSPLCVTKDGKVSKSSYSYLSIDHLIRYKIFPTVIKQYLINGNDFKLYRKSQKVISLEEIIKQNKYYINKTSSDIISRYIFKLYGIQMNTDFIEHFKYFINSVDDLITIHDNINKYFNKELIINKETLLKIKEANLNVNKILLYKLVGNAFNNINIGKEIISYIGLDNLIC